MKITRSQLRKFIQEQVATVNDDAIEDVVMDVLSDEGGAAGLEPIEDALEELEDDEVSLPDEPVEDLVGDVAGVKRHADGDYVDTTQLEARIRKLVGEAKAKMLNETSPMINAEYQQSSYANVNLVSAVVNGVETLFEQVVNDASEDLGDDQEGDYAAANVVVYTLIEALQRIGLVGQAREMEKFLD
tara:strand:+ start:92 stop:652 length:561 start_codon:yes stop_codon:yes gene_type:complete